MLLVEKYVLGHLYLPISKKVNVCKVYYNKFWLDRFTLKIWRFPINLLSLWENSKPYYFYCTIIAYCLLLVYCSYEYFFNDTTIFCGSYYILTKCSGVNKCYFCKLVTHLPVFVIIISVPRSWNLSQSSLVSKWHSVVKSSSQLHLTATLTGCGGGLEGESRSEPQSSGDNLGADGDSLSEHSSTSTSTSSSSSGRSSISSGELCREAGPGQMRIFQIHWIN